MCILFSPFFFIYLRMYYIYAYLNSKHNLELDNLKLLIENIYIITEITFKIAPCFFCFIFLKLADKIIQVIIKSYVFDQMYFGLKIQKSIINYYLIVLLTKLIMLKLTIKINNLNF